MKAICAAVGGMKKRGRGLMAHTLLPVLVQLPVSVRSPMPDQHCEPLTVTVERS
jgi:hypothetical protein